VTASPNQALHQTRAILTTEELLALLPANTNLPASIVMSPEDMVDTALVGLGQGELVTIPVLQDGDEWTRFEAARRAISKQFGNAVPAPRYRIGAPAPA
jgi:short-subunit dehydrogenase